MRQNIDYKPFIFNPVVYGESKLMIDGVAWLMIVSLMGYDLSEDAYHTDKVILKSGEGEFLATALG